MKTILSTALASVLAVSAVTLPLAYSPEVAATYTPKIKNIRIRQTTESGGGSYRLEVVTNDSATTLVTKEGIADPYDIAVTVDKNRVFELQPQPLLRRVSLPLQVTEPAAATLTLELLDASGALLFKGIGRGSAGQSARFESQEYAEGADFRLTQFTVTGTARHGFGFAVDMNGDGSAAVVSARLTSTELTGSKVPVIREAVADDEQISRERLYSTAVSFSADPVGSSYGVNVLLTGEGEKQKAGTTIQMIRLPGNDEVPGPLFGVSEGGFGNGYVPPSASGQTMQAELL